MLLYYINGNKGSIFRVWSRLTDISNVRFSFPAIAKLADGYLCSLRITVYSTSQIVVHGLGASGPLGAWSKSQFPGPHPKPAASETLRVGPQELGFHKIPGDSELKCENLVNALEKEMATRSSVLAWRIPGTEEPGGLPSMGSLRVGHDRSDLAAAVTHQKPGVH